MIRCAVIGASGYAGVELAALIARHPQLELTGVYVSEQSADAGKTLGSLHSRWATLLTMVLTPLRADLLAQLALECDAIFLATDHKVSVDLVPQLLGQRAVIFDLSGGFRFDDAAIYPEYYGFTHQQPALLDQAVYGLAEWQAESIRRASLVAVPGCYPTASLLALKPLQKAGLLRHGMPPVINAVSGVSGAGRKANLRTSFCEVSLSPYGVLGHRHMPEISFHLGTPVVFTPHLGNFKRGILATITVLLENGVEQQQLDQSYQRSYGKAKAVRLFDAGQWPCVDAVANTPFCDLAWKVDPKTGVAVVASAIDNLLKGAASQAIQCANLRFALEDFPFTAEGSV